ncbi:MAG: undecaprenyl/decaprenyl-phosphate alpha-N-acetylglucosaminyl 1-phosphate transferase [Clostridia bacterium]|nr:undecaprenyl/decaprenyl-phosphate alpha-N-acetylglucosaminyl 1-phosphate transferase [Clostridia bacterium]
MNVQTIVYSVAAILCGCLLAFTLTPPVRVLAYRIGAIDVPTDGRRMHKKPIPRIGGLAIYVAFVLATALFCEYSPALGVIWIGGLLLVAIGVLDDVWRLPAWIKLLVQVGAAVITVAQGITLEYINLFGHYIDFGVFAIPVTILWIVGLTNAINLIDGLDGLACGVSAICCLSLVGVILISGRDTSFSLITAILFGCCVGFLPFNSNPAKIFMGDTGALFLGYAMAVISLEGVFKLHTVISFIIPISIFAFPIFDTLSAVIRRVSHGKSPFSADRSHLHHKLVDMGFTHKQCVTILYAISGILGLASVSLAADNSAGKVIAIVGVALALLALYFRILRNPYMRRMSGLYEEQGEEDGSPHEPKDLTPPCITEAMDKPTADEASVQTESGSSEEQNI